MMDYTSPWETDIENSFLEKPLSMTGGTLAGQVAPEAAKMYNSIPAKMGRGMEKAGKHVDEFMSGPFGQVAEAVMSGDDPDAKRRALLKMGITAATGGAAAPFMGLI